MTKLAISRIHPLALAKVLGLLYAVLGLLVGCVLFVLFTIGGFSELAEHDAEEALPAFCAGPFALVLAPIFYGAIGFVGGLIAGALYNVCVKVTGGVVIETCPRD